MKHYRSAAFKLRQLNLRRGLRPQRSDVCIHVPWLVVGATIPGVRRRASRPSAPCYQVRDAMARNCATVDTWALRPPSTVTTCPVKYELSSDARYTHMAAMFSGVP